MGVSRASCSEVWGLEENSRLWRLWLIFAVLLGLIVNFVAVLACLSNVTDTIHLYELDADSLLDAIEIVSNKSSSALESSGLPSSWYWGLAGVCDSNNYCQSSFPPTYTLGEIVESSLRHSLESDSDLKAALSPWRIVIRDASIDGHSETINPKLHDDRAKFLAYSRACVAMAILSLITGAVTLILAIMSKSSRFRNRPRLWKLYILTFMDGALFLVATVLAAGAIHYGPRSLVRYASVPIGSLRTWLDYIGPGMYLLVAGVLLKFIAIAGLFIGFIVFGIVSIALTLICACACLAGAASGANGQRFVCQSCGWSSDSRPFSGYCPVCQGTYWYY